MRTLLLLTVTALSLAGCATSALEADYGASVHLMNRSQVYDVATLRRPSTQAVVGADPDMLNLAVTTLRTQAVDRREVSQPIVVNIGGSGAQ